VSTFHPELTDDLAVHRCFRDLAAAGAETTVPRWMEGVDPMGHGLLG
jgi:hypothetical protein